MDFFDVYVTMCRYHAFSFCTENVTVLYHTHTPSTVLLILLFGNMPAISSYVHVNPMSIVQWPSSEPNSLLRIVYTQSIDFFTKNVD